MLRVPQRRAVNARLNAAEAYVAEAEQALRDTVLEAPYTCQVVECSVGAGARVVAGAAGGESNSSSGADDTDSRSAGRIFRIAQG